MYIKETPTRIFNFEGGGVSWKTKKKKLRLGHKINLKICLISSDIICEKIHLNAGH